MDAEALTAALKLFAAFAGVADDVVGLFLDERPELLRQGDAGAPKSAPAYDIDPELEAKIRAGEL